MDGLYGRLPPQDGGLAHGRRRSAGCDVCMPNLRPDLKDYVGEAGILYDDLCDLPDILSAPPPQEMREAGFEQCQKSDIRNHLHLLTDLWP